jgi:putative CocE/NonD family hydrolase
VRIVDTFPRQVRVVEHCWIPMRDGTRLAARIWLPADAESAPVPAILEYIPYRKRDLTRTRDEPMHAWFAGHGYAAVRVDVRGAGDSEGILTDEYAEEEIADGVEVIAWIAAQRWCTGAVGMMGMSWGGFNALQVAARRPPALKAIVTVCSSDDRYADDAHYMGGCLLNENLTWGTALLNLSALPPDPEIVGDGWRDIWHRRIAAAVPFPQPWLRHQRRDDYWRHGSVCEDPRDITCPVLAVGGWADAYSNAVPRLVPSVGARGLVGPWAHLYPHNGVPGPAIGFLQEVLRWWDRWLANKPDRAPEPAYRVWMQGDPGRWVAERAWPSPDVTPTRWALEPGRLAQRPGPERRFQVCSPEHVGLGSGDWCSFGAAGDLPGDQHEDDRGSLAFDSEPLAKPVEILGAPVVVLDLAADRPQGMVCVRLNELRADGYSTRVTYGLLNLSHRDGHEEPEALVPGRRYTVRVRLNDVAHAFEPGSRVRVAISTGYWPIAWPSPEPVTLSVFTGASYLELPVREPRAEDEALRAFEPPESAPPAPYTPLRPATVSRRLERDGGDTVYVVESDAGGLGAGAGRLDDIDLEVGHSLTRRYRIGNGDPTSARAEVVQTTELRRGHWAVRVKTQASLRATREVFVLRVHLEAYEGETLVRSRAWDVELPRDHV